jgi:GT2 family glycosyltransferase
MIGRAVQSVLANTAVQFELLVIDQSDGTETEEIVAQFPKARYLRTDSRGLSAARNLGARSTTAPVIAFTDDDCEVPPDWLGKALSALDSEPRASLCYGTVLPAPELESKDGAVPCLIVAERRLVGGAHGYHLFGMGANMVIRRAAFERIGGFDRLLGAGGALRSAEDFDLQFRAHKLGLSTLLEPDLQVVHYGFRTWQEWHGLFSRDGVGVGAFFSKHIRLRDPLAARALVELTGMETLRAAKSLLAGGDARRLVFVRGIISGVFQGFRFPIDRQTRQYELRATT